MHTLGKYIIRRQIWGVAGALLVIGAFDFIADFIGETSHIDDDYTMSRALVFSFLSLPQRLGELAPAAVLIGTIMSLGALSANFELTAMRAGGYSKYQLTAPALLVGVLIALLVALNKEFVVPHALSAAEAVKAAAEPADARVREGDRVWFRDRNRFVTALVVGESHEQQFRDAAVFEVAEDAGLHAVVRAREMRISDAGMELYDVQRGKFEAEGMSFKDAGREIIPLSPWALEVRTELDPGRMSAGELLDYVRFMRASHINSDAYEMALWTHISHPLSVIVLLLLAMPFVFAPFQRAGTGRRLFFGIMLGLVCFILNRTLSSFALIQQWPAWFAVFLPLVLFSLFGAWRFRLCR